MPYVANTWPDGSTITEPKLENLETGIQEALQPITVRQTVLSALADSDGRPAFLALGGAPVLASTTSVPTMTNNTSPSGAVSASSNAGAQYTEWHAFDGTTSGESSTFWYTGSVPSSGAPQWLAYEFASQQLLGGYSLRARDDATFCNMAPSEWTFEGWNGSTWDVLDTRTAQTGWTAAQKRSYTFSTSTLYTKFRWNITGNDGSGAGLAVLEAEMYALGYPSLDLDTDGGASPCIITCADGAGTLGPANLRYAFDADQVGFWSSLTASSTLYLYTDHSTTPPTAGFSTLAPKYQDAAPGSPSTGQHWYDVQAGQMKRWSGAAWVDVSRVFVGECTTDGSGNVSSRTAYALRGEYAPGRIAASASTATTKNHNLGTDNVVAMCFQATSAGGSLTPCALTGLTAKTVSFTTAASVVEVVPIVRRAF